MITFVAVNGDGSEYIYDSYPIRHKIYDIWMPDLYEGYEISLPKGSIKKLIGRELTWKDEPVELTKL